MGAPDAGLALVWCCLGELASPTFFISPLSLQHKPSPLSPIAQDHPTLNTPPALAAIHASFSLRRRPSMAPPQALIDGVSYTGTAVACILIASQCPLMWEVYKGKRSINDMSPWPTVGQMANFLSWCVYGLEQGDPNILRVNVIGVVFCLGYFGMFCAYATGPARATFFKLLVAFVLVQGAFFGGVLGAGGLTTASRVSLLGYWAVGANV